MVMVMVMATVITTDGAEAIITDGGTTTDESRPMIDGASRPIWRPAFGW
jgi:hypothetical protein